MNGITFKREDLYQLVWQEPITSLASKHNVSAIDIRSACKKMNIPVPDVGYWTKLKFKKQAVKHTLPIHSDTNEITLECIHDKHKKEPKLPSIRNTNMQANFQNNKPDKLVVEAGKFLRSKDRYINDGLVSCYGEVLQIRVSKTYIDRALHLYDSFIKALRISGHDIHIENKETILIVNGEKFVFTLREKLKRIEVPGRPKWNKYDKATTGLFIFKWDYFWGREWIDGKQKLEEQVNDIIKWLENKTIEIKKEREENALRNAEREKERQKKQAKKSDVENEVIKFKELLAAAKRFQESQIILQYLHQAEITSTDNPEYREWLEWGKRKAEWYNPTINADDELLDYVDKETFKIKNPWDFI